MRYNNPRDPHKPDIEYAKGSKDTPAKSTKDYFPEEIIGRCSECSVACTLEFPPGTFSWTDGDRIMEYYSVNNVHCLNCKRMVQFKPIDLRNPTERDMKELGPLLRAQGKLLGRLQG